MKNLVKLGLIFLNLLSSPSLTILLNKNKPNLTAQTATQKTTIISVIFVVPVIFNKAETENKYVMLPVRSKYFSV